VTRALEPVWEPIQAALDARRDPLDDPRVAEFLAERPDAAREYAELVLALERVGRVSPEHARPTPLARPRDRVAAAAVLLLLLGALAFFATRAARRPETPIAESPRAPSEVDEPRASPRSAPSAPTHTPADSASDATAFGVTHYRIERVRTTPNGREVVVLEDGRVARCTTTASEAAALAVTIERTTWAARGQELR